jgi:hypothetical protein
MGLALCPSLEMSIAQAFAFVNSEANFENRSELAVFFKVHGYISQQ